jgi:hypothetical protein
MPDNWFVSPFWTRAKLYSASSSWLPVACCPFGTGAIFLDIRRVVEILYNSIQSPFGLAISFSRQVTTNSYGHFEKTAGGKWTRCRARALFSNEILKFGGAPWRRFSDWEGCRPG